MQLYLVGGQSQFEKLGPFFFFFFKAGRQTLTKDLTVFDYGDLGDQGFFFLGALSQEFLIPAAHLSISLLKKVLNNLQHGGEHPGSTCVGLICILGNRHDR